jgi:hypothetical protein
MPRCVQRYARLLSVQLIHSFPMVSVRSPMLESLRANLVYPVEFIRSI